MEILFEMKEYANGEVEELTNFRVAEAVINLCDNRHSSCKELDAEVVARMILLERERSNNNAEANKS